MQSQNRWRKLGIEAALLSAILMGFAPIFGKKAFLAGFSPDAVVAFRTGLAFLLVLMGIALFQRRYFYIYPLGLVGCFLAGVTNGVGSIFYYSGLSRVDASVGHMLYSFYPIFVGIWLTLDHQPVSRFTLVRLLLSLPAIYLLTQTGLHPVDALGAIFMLISSALYALHLIINQRVLYEVPAQTVTLYTLLAMSVVVIPVYLIFDRSLPAIDPAFLFRSWWPVLALAGVTFLSRLTLFLGVKHLGGMQTALLGLGELLVTILLAQWWLGERLSIAQWIGSLLLSVNLILVGFEKSTPIANRNGLLEWLQPPKSKIRMGPTTTSRWTWS
jgi:drug/metabolite transporter (DMT)-like permease